MDLNAQRIADWNDKDLTKLPIYEPGLDEVIKVARDATYFFTFSLAIDDAEMIFISVNTPTKTYGAGKGMAPDLKYVSNVHVRLPK